MLNALAQSSARPPVRKLAVGGMPVSGKPDELMQAAHIDAEAVVEAARQMLAQVGSGIGGIGSGSGPGGRSGSASGPGVWGWSGPGWGWFGPGGWGWSGPVGCGWSGPGVIGTGFGGGTG